MADTRTKEEKAKRQQYVHAQIAAAKRLSEKYHVPVTVIAENRRALIPWINGGQGATIYAIVPEKDFNKTFEAIKEDPEFMYLDISGMQPVHEMVEVIRRNPKVISYNLGGQGFIPPFFFNKEVYGTYGVELRRALEENFGPLLREQIQARVANWRASRKELHGMAKKQNRQVLERHTKLAGPIETKELLRQIAWMAKTVKARKGEVLVAFDKSGRPVGAMLKRALREAYGINLPLFFISPKLVKANSFLLTRNAKDGRAKTKELHAQLEHDNPLLVKAIVGKKVILVDDQVWHGDSFSGTKALLRKYTPKKTSTVCLS